MLSLDSQRVLQAAWEESLRTGGAPIDTADLLVGLMSVPRTAEVLEGLGINVERIRAAKRDARGYDIASRFQSAVHRQSLKSPRMGRIAELVAESTRHDRRDFIEPEDILESIAIDGLGWGMRILEQLGVSGSVLLQEIADQRLLATLPHALGAHRPRTAAERRRARFLGQTAFERVATLLRLRRVGRTLTPIGRAVQVFFKPPA